MGAGLNPCPSPRRVRNNAFCLKVRTHGSPQNNASNNNQTIEQVFYAGTATLKAGEAVAYDLDDTNAPVTSTTLDRKNLRGRRVVDPATAVLGMFAGLVDEGSAGITGPAYISIVKPRRGDVVQAFTKSNMTKGSTVLGITNAGARSLVTSADATFNVDMVAIAMETKDTSTTAASALVKFL
jgi:hypothetical protein